MVLAKSAAGVADLCSLLAHEGGRQVRTATTVEECTRFARAERVAAIAAYVSVRAPTMWQFVEELRQRAETAAIPLIVLSACGTSDDCKRARHLGADAFLAGSAGSEDLTRTLLRMAGTAQRPPQDGSGDRADWLGGNLTGG